jgi:hypothetical protein
MASLYTAFDYPLPFNPKALIIKFLAGLLTRFTLRCLPIFRQWRV